MATGWGEWIRNAATAATATPATATNNEEQPDGQPQTVPTASATEAVDKLFSASKAWLAAGSERLSQLQLPQTAPDGTADSASVSGSAQGKGVSSAPSEEMKEKAMQLGKGFLTGVSTFATTIKSSVEQVKEDWDREQQRFAEQKRKYPDMATGVAPWVGCADEEQIKLQILSLSSDKRNFLVDPPPGAQFPFDYDSYTSTAIATMQADPALQQQRYDLVPKRVSEVNFWRNYFYRVSLIKQQSTLSSLSRENTLTNLSEPRATATPVQSKSEKLLEEAPPKPRKMSHVSSTAETTEFASEEHHRPTTGTMHNETTSINSSSKSTSLLEEPTGAVVTENPIDDLDDIEKELNELELELDGVDDTPWSGDDDIDEMLK